MRTDHRKHRQSGHQILEFALFAIVLVPLLLGTFVVGMNLSRAVLVSQLGRDAGSMYVRGVDFSQTPNQEVLVRLGQRLGMAVNGGRGVVILSKLTYIAAGGCTQPCNAAKYVVTQRLVVGNSAARSSAFGPQGSVTLDAQGNVANYVTDPNAVAPNFGNTLTMNGGEFVYVTETYFPSPDFDLPGYQSGSGVYSVAFY